MKRGDVRVRSTGQARDTQVEVFDGADWLPLARVVAAVVTIDARTVRLKVEVLGPGLDLTVPAHQVLAEAAAEATPPAG